VERSSAPRVGQHRGEGDGRLTQRGEARDDGLRRRRGGRCSGSPTIAAAGSEEGEEGHGPWMKSRAHREARYSARRSRSRRAPPTRHEPRHPTTSAFVRDLDGVYRGALARVRREAGLLVREGRARQRASRVVNKSGGRRRSLRDATGIELVDQLRAPGQHLPVVFLTRFWPMTHRVTPAERPRVAARSRKIDPLPRSSA
jgi:hypothetical protein